MELIVDLHVHSHYSRATSKHCNLEGLYEWGKKKGIHVIGTGDFTHPYWLSELQEKLEPAESGLWRIKASIADKIDAHLPASVQGSPIRFVPTVEIATIYSKNSRVRKLHQLIIMPSLEAAKDLNARLERIGNLEADGRPALGLDAKELLRLTLEVEPNALYIPAHIWTPWFGLFGSKSGFDTLLECYEELTPQIRAIETGLSSDPLMNRRLAQLETISITSHSDAHSPQKLGREATVVKAPLSYDEVIGAIKANDKRLVGTIEFFPEEGKYHYDGHRACNVRFSPQQTKERGGICPVCSQPVVVGVDYRVGELADQVHGSDTKRTEYIVPLAEILAEQRGVKSPGSARVMQEFEKIIAHLGNEFSVLRSVPIETIYAYSPALAQAIERLRQGDVIREPGYDGVYGKIKVFGDSVEKFVSPTQQPLF